MLKFLFYPVSYSLAGSEYLIIHMFPFALHSHHSIIFYDFFSRNYFSFTKPHHIDVGIPSETSSTSSAMVRSRPSSHSNGDREGRWGALILFFFLGDFLMLCFSVQKGSK